MYTPDINLIKRRATGGYLAVAPRRSDPVAPTVGILAGVVLALLFVGTYTAATLFFGSRLQTVRARQTEITQELSIAEAEQARLELLDQELQEASERTEAFKSLFTRVQPWSAILNEIRNSVPDDTWISAFNAGGDTISLSGESLSFDKVNDFQLALLQSPVVADARILNASVVDATEDRFAVVNYAIDIQLATTPLGELLDSLASQGRGSPDGGLQRKLDILRELEVN